MRLSRYVHLNPVCIQAREKLDWRARAEILRNYQWSSYGGYIEEGWALDFVTAAPVLALMEGPARQRRDRYRQYVEAGLVERDEELAEMMKRTVRGVGTEEFQEEIEQRHEVLLGERHRPEDIASRHRSFGIQKEKVLEQVSQGLAIDPEALQRRGKGQWERGIVAYVMTKHAGMTQREVADLIGVRTGAAVSLLLARLRRELEINNSLREQLENIEANLRFKG